MTRSLRALLDGIVDYAGLFPPASLVLDASMRNYGRYINAGSRWMLGRFVVPAARLHEVSLLISEYRDGEKWQIAAVVGDDVADAMERVSEFNSENATALVDMLEVRADSDEAIAHVASAVPAGVRVFVEIPSAGDPRPLVRAIAGARLGAKIRTGGVTPDAIPPVEDVARFIRACYGANVPFKATAGLHHPVRAEQMLTYDDDSPRSVMHGFFNVFLAAAFCFNGLGVADAPRVLMETDPAAFTFDNDGVSWDQYRISTAEIEKIRRRFAISFGSCSFDEPLADLKTLGLL